MIKNILNIKIKKFRNQLLKIPLKLKILNWLKVIKKTIKLMN